MTGLAIQIMYFGNLNDFLPRNKKNKPLIISVRVHQTVKDIIEANGVPHAEVDIILLNGISVTFNKHVREGDNLEAFPIHCYFRKKKLRHLIPAPLKTPKFMMKPWGSSPGCSGCAGSIRHFSRTVPTITSFRSPSVKEGLFLPAILIY